MEAEEGREDAVDDEQAMELGILRGLPRHHGELRRNLTTWHNADIDDRK